MSKLFGALFIPLAGWAFDQFAAGTKFTEYRLYGPRWNEQTCPVGRLVVLSRGYGTSHRLLGKIASLSSFPAPPDPAAWEKAYGSPWKGDGLVAAIRIDVIGPLVKMTPVLPHWRSVGDCTTLIADERNPL